MIEESNRRKKRKVYVPTQILRTLPEATLPEATITDKHTTLETVDSQKVEANTNVEFVSLQETTSMQQELNFLPEETPLSHVPSTHVEQSDSNVQHKGRVETDVNQDLEDSDTTIVYNAEDVKPDNKKSIHHCNTWHQNYQTLKNVHLPKMWN